MSILERARKFVESVRELARRTEREWRQCPHCGSRNTIKNGHYTRNPWTLEGRKVIRVQRHFCKDCRHSYSEELAELVRRSWYSRGVHRATIDHWQHGGSSLRRVAEFMRSWIGRQERWQMWMPFAEKGRERERCWLGASTVQRWLVKAGEVAQESVPGQMKGIACSGEMGTDGLWARLRGGEQRVALMLVDYVTGLVWPPIVAAEEASRQSWAKLFDRAKEAGLTIDTLNGITSDGALGLVGYLRNHLSAVHQQRCIWHLWRSLCRQIAKAVARSGAQEPQSERRAKRRELSKLLEPLMNAQSYETGEAALARLANHDLGSLIALALHPLMDAILVHLLPCHKGLCRVGPEWYWRDFRLRLGHGRNHGSDQRLEQALLVWAIYRNFTPAQRRSEQKRHYRHPGLSPLEVAGAPPGDLCYLDALQV